MIKYDWFENDLFLIHYLNNQPAEISERPYKKATIEKVVEVPPVTEPIPNNTTQSTESSDIVFRDNKSSNDTEIGDKFKIEKRGALAYMIHVGEKQFKVLAGSTIRAKEAPNFKTSKKAEYLQRITLKENGTIDENGKFTKDFVFTSKSAAACVVLGGSESGTKEWERKEE